MAPREQPETGVSTAPLGINREGETWKELDQGQHREGLARGGGAEWQVASGASCPRKASQLCRRGAPAWQVSGGQAPTSSSRYTQLKTQLIWMSLEHVVF